MNFFLEKDLEILKQGKKSIGKTRNCSQRIEEKMNL